MKKGFTSIALTIVLIWSCIISTINRNIIIVYADPYNIELRVETKEISIEEISENRSIEVEVYLNNVPNEDFHIFNATYKLDHKLDNLINFTFGVKAVPSLSIEASTQNNCLFIETDTVVHSNKKIENGRVYNIKLYLPEEVSEGDFYEITPIPDCGNGIDSTSFVLFSNKKEVFGPSNFSFVGGGIKIRSSQPEQPISNEPVPPTNNDNINSQSEIHDTQVPIINEPKEETTTPTLSPETTSTAITTTTSSTKTTPKVTSVTSTEQKISETAVDTNTEPINTTEKKDDNNKTSNIKLILLIVIILLIISIILIITIRKRKKK